jgi:hypothetical protein
MKKSVVVGLRNLFLNYRKKEKVRKQQLEEKC